MMIEISEEGVIFCGGLTCDGKHRCHGCPLEYLKHLFDYGQQ